MRKFGLSQVGQYHIREGSDICQDSFSIIEITDTISVAVVADGVGSEEHSEIASKIATESFSQYCKNHYCEDIDLSELMSKAFYAAYFSVVDESRNKEISMDQLDCTLCAVILTPDAAYCGNVGDSGAIGLNKNGEYILLTDQQNDEFGRVFPLRDISKWIINKISNDFVSVLVATDGFYNYLFPPYLKVLSEDGISKVLDFEKISKYIDTNVIHDIEDLDGYVLDLVNCISRDGGWESIDDDLTVVGLSYDIEHDVNENYTGIIDRDLIKKQYYDKIHASLYPDKHCYVGSSGTSYLTLRQIYSNDVETVYEAYKNKIVRIYSGLSDDILIDVENNAKRLLEDPSIDKCSFFSPLIDLIYDSDKFIGIVEKKVESHSISEEQLDLLLPKLASDIKLMGYELKLMGRLNIVCVSGALIVLNVPLSIWDVNCDIILPDLEDYNDYSSRVLQSFLKKTLLPGDGE